MNYYKKNKTYIFRAIQFFNGDFGFVDPSKGQPRMSANTANFMTLFMDNLPAWKKYPKRSKSIICSTKREEAIGRGGGKYIVFPYDNANIGVCSDRDVWMSFPVLYPSLVADFNDDIQTLLYEIEADRKKAQIDYNYLLESLAEMTKEDFSDDIIQEIETGIIKDLVQESFAVSKSEIEQYFNDELDPKRNGFSLAKVGQKIPDTREIWIDSPCVVVDIDIVESIME